uniref:Cadherin domain-containing protein n=1 Tax=Ciona savignyi TaxID=51511 RepID=H2YNK8_CIOSA
ISINIQDNNDNEPAFDFTEYSAYIPENATRGAKVLTVHATDLDEGANGMVRYTINRGSDVHRLFSVDPVSGVVTLVGQLDYEVATTHRLSLEAHDGGLPVLEVVVNSPNLHPPVFSTKVHRVRISEIAPIGSYVANVAATDRDRGITGRLRYRLAQGDVNNWFRIDAQSGLITTSSRLRYQTTNHVTLIVTAQDESSMPRFANCSVEVAITDADDNPPVFVHTTRTISTTEAQPPGPLITVQATDVDTVGKSIVYSISRVFDENNHVVLNDEFVINPTSGEISTTATLTRDVSRSYNLSVVASNQLSVATIEIVVEVSDTNDNPPYFAGQLAFSIRENEPKGTYIGTVRAYDADIGIHGSIVYSLPSEDVAFVIDPHTGWIMVSNSARLNIEEKMVHELVVEVSDTTGSSGRCVVEVQLSGVNDNSPIFQPSSLTWLVPESAPLHSEIGRLRATDYDVANGIVTYRIVGHGGGGEVEVGIDPNSGRLSVGGRLDREQFLPDGLFRITVVATDSATHPINALQVVITVLDFNDNAPLFQQSFVEVFVSETTSPGDVISTASARDVDQSQSISYSLRPITGSEDFRIDPRSAEVTVVYTGLFDREVQDLYSFIVRAVDTGGELDNVILLSRVFVEIENINDNPPVFQLCPPRVVVSEGVDVGQYVTTIQANDADIGLNGIVEYYIVSGDASGQFKIAPDTGVVTVQRPLDHEIQPQFNLVVMATDAAPISSRHRSYCDIIIEVSDINDHAPQLLSPPTFGYMTQVMEGESPGSIVLRVGVVDGDHGLNGRERVGYYMGGMVPTPCLHFTISSTGIVTLTQALDREEASQYTLDVIAVDRGTPSLTSTGSILIIVGDVNEFTPVFQPQSYWVNISENAGVGVEVTQVSAVDHDAG